MINDLWYKNAIIYCLSVSTYMDANGDGIGDFQGLVRRLDYLQGLGVTAIWLMPFKVSPLRDDGYDVVLETSSNSPTPQGSGACAC
jgi:maltose alpha-D-glucosyltransferase / alpha-amylase